MLNNKVCLITGANAGIGKAAALQLAEQGVAVVLACRNQARGEAALDCIKRKTGSPSVFLMVMDLSSRESIRNGCQQFREMGHRRLDVLIHNAADFDISRKQPLMSADGVEKIWATNHLGPVFLTHCLQAELSAAEQARVITVSSQGLVMYPRLQVSFTDPEFTQGGYSVNKAYYQSKLAQVMYTFWLAEQFRGTGKTANCVRVTNVMIDLDRYPGLPRWQKALYSLKSRFSITPEKMAEVYVWLALSPELTDRSGGYFDEKRRGVGAGAWATNPANIRRLMALTQEFIPELSV